MTSGLFSIPASGNTVVVVDDEQGILRAARRLLQTMGLHCVVASDGARALELVRTFQPAVVIADYQMPDVDGVVTLRRVGDVSPGSVRVLMTGYADAQILERALNEAHAEFYLPKPFRSDQLRDVVGRALQRGHRTRQGEAALAATSAERVQLNAIATAQRELLTTHDVHKACERLLHGALEVTGSEYGFIGEALAKPDGKLVLRSLAITNLAWDDATRAAFAAKRTTGLVFDNMDTLFGEAMLKREVVIANEASTDSRAGGVPPGHPPLDAFLGVPFVERGKLVGMIGLANRPGGYSLAVVEALQPFVQTCTTILQREAAESQGQVVESQLGHARQRLQATFDAALDGLVLATNDGVIRQVNPSLCKMFGYEAHELLNQSLGVLLPPRTRAESEQLLARHGTTDSSMRVSFQRRVEGLHRGGREFPVELSMVSIDDPVQGHSLAVTLRDLTPQLRQEQALATVNAELAKANEDLRRLARTDGLTGLFNRRHFDDMLQAEIHRSLRSGQGFALALCDIDFFKELNDHLGHQAGDGYLVQLAQTLDRTFRRSGELVARWGGEEFAILVPHVSSLEEASGVGKRLLAAVRAANLARPVCATGEQLSVSVGVAWNDAGALTAAELLRAADTALYGAKDCGRDTARLAPQVETVPLRGLARG